MSVSIYYDESDGSAQIVTHKATYFLDASEWAGLIEAMPCKVSIVEKRPIFALFGTRTKVRWLKP